MNNVYISVKLLMIFILLADRKLLRTVSNMCVASQPLLAFTFPMNFMRPIKYIQLADLEQTNE